jgi:hypothetical protein
MQRPQGLYFPKKSDSSPKKSDRLAACRTHGLLARAGMIHEITRTKLISA